MPFDIGGFIYNSDRIENDARAGIVTNGLVLHLDAGIPESYPKSDTTWYDLSGNANNGVINADARMFFNSDGNLNYTLVDFDFVNVGHPTDESGLDAIFTNGTNVQTGLHSGEIAWGNGSQAIRWGGTASAYPAYHTRREAYGWKVEGYIYLPEDGTYNFQIDGDDACDFFINGVKCAYWYDGHGFGTGGTGTSQTFSKGWYTFIARVEEGGGGDGIAVGWQKPSDGALSTIPGHAFSSYLPVRNIDLFRFDGVNDFVSIPNITMGNGNIAWTISAWIKTSTTVNALGQGSIISNASGGPVYSMLGVNNGKIVYWTYQNNAWSQKLGTSTVNDNKWHLLTWVNNTNSTMDMYVDGILDATVANSTSGNDNPLDRIGGSWAGSYDGFISNILIYKNKILSPAEVLKNFNATRNRFGV